MGRDDFAALALIQRDVVDKLGKFVRSRDGAERALLVLDGKSDLWVQLQSANAIPKGVDVGFLDEVGGLALSRIFGSGNPLDRIREMFEAQLGELQAIVTADTPAEALRAARRLFERPLDDLWSTVGPFLSSQLSIAVSFATTAAVMAAHAGPALQDAILQYFFTRDGFQTIDGMTIVAPIHLESLDLGEPSKLKGMFSMRTGERYIRDLIRLMVEAADDLRYGLRARHAFLLEQVGPAKQKYTDWFKGFASMAEAAVTSAVEEACQGLSTFQTSPLIAASAGRFAGTAARKATQHVFLAELEHLRPKHM